MFPKAPSTVSQSRGLVCRCPAAAARAACTSAARRSALPSARRSRTTAAPCSCCGRWRLRSRHVPAQLHSWPFAHPHACMEARTWALSHACRCRTSTLTCMQGNGSVMTGALTCGNGGGWCGWGVPSTPGQMVGANAVIVKACGSCPTGAFALLPHSMMTSRFLHVVATQYDGFTSASS